MNGDDDFDFESALIAAAEAAETKKRRSSGPRNASRAPANIVTSASSLPEGGGGEEGEGNPEGPPASAFSFSVRTSL